MGEDGYLVDSVDQTVAVPDGARAVFVPDNIRPGSHLFTVLSDYAIPVIAAPQSLLDSIKDKKVKVYLDDGQCKVEECT